MGINDVIEKIEYEKTEDKKGKTLAFESRGYVGLGDLYLSFYSLNEKMLEEMGFVKEEDLFSDSCCARYKKEGKNATHYVITDSSAPEVMDYHVITVARSLDNDDVDSEDKYNHSLVEEHDAVANEFFEKVETTGIIMQKAKPDGYTSRHIQRIVNEQVHRDKIIAEVCGKGSRIIDGLRPVIEVSYVR